MKRYLSAILFASLILCVAVHAPPAVWGDVGPGEKIELKDLLAKGLKARRPQEFSFIDQVVGLVGDGVLPEKMVTSTFEWAREKRPHPFPYFERGLKVRAKKELGIKL